MEKQTSSCMLSVVIPNYNGMQYIKRCLDSLMAQTWKDLEIIFVDNGSADGSREYVMQQYPSVRLVALPENTGFCGAVNVGIRLSKGAYVVLCNNDTEAEPDFLEQLYLGIKDKPKAFSGAAMMIRFTERDKIDDAGNFYNALGWAFARGKGKPLIRYQKEGKIFSSCGGAAIYRKELLDLLGGFDEEHFAYLEDTDIGYRAQIHGYENWYLPKARIYHVGSGTTGSRYNLFKIRYSSRNNIYMLRKNMPLLQMLLNLPFLLLGFGVKLLFFAAKGFGREYAAGIKNGFTIPLKDKKVRYRHKHFLYYCRIQIQLWINIFRRFR